MAVAGADDDSGHDQIGTRIQGLNPGHAKHLNHSLHVIHARRHPRPPSAQAYLRSKRIYRGQRRVSTRQALAHLLAFLAARTAAWWTFFSSVC